ncbi:hypothetical protein DICA1_A05424 [Diutina catenulata]
MLITITLVTTVRSRGELEMRQEEMMHVLERSGGHWSIGGKTPAETPSVVGVINSLEQQVRHLTLRYNQLGSKVKREATSQRKLQKQISESKPTWSELKMERERRRSDNSSQRQCQFAVDRLQSSSFTYLLEFESYLDGLKASWFSYHRPVVQELHSSIKSLRCTLKHTTHANGQQKPQAALQKILTNLTQHITGIDGMIDGYDGGTRDWIHSFRNEISNVCSEPRESKPITKPHARNVVFDF